MYRKTQDYITCHCTISYSLECEGNINQPPYFTTNQGRVHFPGRDPQVSGIHSQLSATFFQQCRDYETYWERKTETNITSYQMKYRH